MNALTKGICKLAPPRKTGHWPDNLIDKLLPEELAREVRLAETQIRAGRFQRSLSTLAGGLVVSFLRPEEATAKIFQQARDAHPVGASRMGRDPAKSVVDKFGHSHDIAKPLVCDGSVLPTQTSANPGRTIQTLAARTADLLISRGVTVFNSDKWDVPSPPIRPELFPPGTRWKGVPRLG